MAPTLSPVTTGVAGSDRTTSYQVEGLCCAAEARQIEAKLQPLSGIARLAIDPVRHVLIVEGEIPPALVERAVAELGMKARRMGAEREQKESWWKRRGRLVLAIVAGALWAAVFAMEHLLGSDPWARVFALGAVVAGGWYVFPRGLRAARNRALDMNFLMSVATAGALLIGEWEEAASVMFLFAVAQLLEILSMDRARNAIRSLMDLSPAEASVLREGEEVRVRVDEVQVGETVVVRPGQKVPVDGEVVAGRSTLDQSPITGESIPVEKEPGDEVFAGTLNGDGALEIRSARPAADTTLARIIHSVEDAQASRAPSQTFVDRFARVYTPMVVGCAVAVSVVPPLLGLGSWSEWFYRALVLLVVACPCALVISTPVTVVSALAGAARRGILIKGGLHLENAGRARAIALDKTGTLTCGEPNVVSVVALNGSPERRVVELAAAAEARSEHPLARAVLRHAASEGIGILPASGTSATPGRGVRARVDGHTVHVGSVRLFEEMGGLDPEVRWRVSTFADSGKTAVVVGATHEVEGGRPDILGLLVIADRLRPEAAESLQALRRGGIRHIAMLTGDNPGTARSIAQDLAATGGRVDSIHAGLLPEDKVAAIRELRRRYGTLLMVGDGVNDAPALAASDVGVAMGSAGTDVALETADIALMADDLSRLPTAIRLARKAEGIIRANITFALLTKAVFVVLAVLGYATLWMAVFADMGASLLVVLNGLRALRE